MVNSSICHLDNIGLNYETNTMLLTRVRLYHVANITPLAWSHPTREIELVNTLKKQVVDLCNCIRPIINRHNSKLF